MAVTRSLNAAGIDPVVWLKQGILRVKGDGKLGE